MGRRLARLPCDAAARLEQARIDEPGTDAAKLTTKLRVAFGVQPLIIGAIWSIKFEMHKRNFVNEYRCRMSGYLAEAEVLYRGDPVYWRLRLSSDFNFGYRGRVGTHSVKLRTFLDDKDFAWFERDVNDELTSARSMLSRMAGEQVLATLKANEVIDDVIAKSPPANLSG